MVREYTSYVSNSFKFIEKFYRQACGLTWKLFCVCIKAFASYCCWIFCWAMLSELFRFFIYFCVYLLGAHWILVNVLINVCVKFQKSSAIISLNVFSISLSHLLLWLSLCVCWDHNAAPCFPPIFPQSLSSVFLSYMVLIDLSSSPLILSSVIWNLL